MYDCPSLLVLISDFSYGEIGSRIISRIILQLFPPHLFPAASTSPISPAEFIHKILVPEAALHLVMDDMRQSRREAVCTLRESSKYGVGMFPDDSTGKTDSF